MSVLNLAKVVCVVVSHRCKTGSCEKLQSPVFPVLLVRTVRGTLLLRFGLGHGFIGANNELTFDSLSIAKRERRVWKGKIVVIWFGGVEEKMDRFPDHTNSRVDEAL